LSGAGKTHQAIEIALQITSNSPQKILIVQPTIELIDQSYQLTTEKKNHPTPINKIHSGTSKKVHSTLVEHLKKASPVGEILFITHQTFLTIPYFPNKSDWIVIIDEIPTAIRSVEINLSDSHKTITAHINAISNSPDTYALSPKNGHEKYLREYARNVNKDAVYEIFMDLAEMILSKNWNVSIKKKIWDRIVSNNKSSSRVKLQAFGELSTSVISGFGEVIIMGANFEESILHLLWKKRVNFTPKKEIQNNLRWSHHENSGLISIKYFTDRVWSKSLRDKEIEYNGKKDKLGNFYIHKTRELMDQKTFIWSANNDIPNEVFIGMDGTRMSGCPHGLNQFQDVDNVICLSALNPTPALFSFYKEQGISPEELICAFTHNSAYQTIMRSSIRDQENGNEKLVIVPDLATAEWLLEMFPQATIEKINGVPEVASRRLGGRPKIKNALTPKERVKLYRIRNKQVKEIHEYLNNGRINYMCNGNHYINYSSFRDVLGTISIFKSVCHSEVLMEISLESVDDYFNFLNFLSTRPMEYKDGNLLMSPAVFLGSRSIENVKSVWGIVIDLDDTDMAPDEFMKFFPDLKMALMNTFSGNGRFRVFIPTTTDMDYDTYVHIQKAIVQQVESNGFIDGKKNMNIDLPRHGIDMGKTGPESIFYLPCTAQNPKDSFFIEQDGDLLDPQEWIKKPASIKQKVGNIIPITQHNKTEDLSKEELEKEIKKAISKYQAIPSGVGRRYSGFFNLGLRLYYLVPLDKIQQYLHQADLDGSRRGKRQIEGVLKSLQSGRYGGNAA